MTPQHLKKEYTFEANVELFPQDKGWHYVKVPGKHVGSSGAHRDGSNALRLNGKHKTV